MTQEENTGELGAAPPEDALPEVLRPLELKKTSDAAGETGLEDWPDLGTTEKSSFSEAPENGANGLGSWPSPSQEGLGLAREENVLGRVAASSAVRSSAIFPAVRLGAAAGLLAPPGAQVFTVPAGVIIGAGIALWAGDRAAKRLEESQSDIFLNPEKVPDEQRGSKIAGQVLGSGLSMTGQVPLLGALGGRLPPSAVGSAINRVLDTAKNRPFWYSWKEGTATTSAAIAEGIYEEMRPSHPWERLGVGLVTGMVNPVDLGTLRLGSAVWNAGKWFWSTGAGKLLDLIEPRVPDTGVLKSATNILREIVPDKRAQLLVQNLARLFEASGDDPRTFMALAAERELILGKVPGLETGTVAAVTGNPRLAQLEKNLGEQDRVFFGDKAAAMERASKAITNVIEALGKIGSPDALKAAAKLRYERHIATLKRLEAYATKEAVDAADAIARGGRQGDKAELSRAVANTFGGALDKARAVGAELAEKVFPDKSKPGSFDAIFEMMSTLQKDMVEIPGVVTEKLFAIAAARRLLTQVKSGAIELESGVQITPEAIKNARELTSVSELMRLRSRFLALARDAATSTANVAAMRSRDYGLMAEAALDDMLVSGVATRAAEAGRRGAGGRFSNMTAYDEFREYERALYDVFKRTFGGVIGEKGAHGYKLPPEALMKEAFGSGDEVAALRFKELLDGVQFLPKRGIADIKLLEAAETDIRLAIDAQQQWLRLAADRARDPVTGEVKLQRLGEFIRNSDELMQRFPEVAEDLHAAVKAKVRLDVWADRIAGVRSRLDSSGGIFGRLLKTDSPSQAVEGALSSLQPITELDAMLKLARNHGPEAVAGFRAAIWNAVFAASRKGAGALGGGEVSEPTAYLTNIIAALDKPIRTDLPSVLQYFTSRQLMGERELEVLNMLKGAAKNIEIAMSTQPTGEASIQHVGMFERLLTAAFGSWAGRHALDLAMKAVGTKKNVGQSLIIAQKSSSAADKVISQLPREAAQKLLADAFSGAPLRPGGKPYSLWDMLVKKAAEGSPGEEVQKAYRLHAYAWASGLLSTQEQMSSFAPAPEEPATMPAEEPGFIGRVKQTLFGGDNP